ncbi:hypothetical protein AMTRI_Chr06g200960 [Amborella trichopoda]|uniref:TLC domain-containing protein n=1 Tax=Amborella trichopoda TaxID=13333 RepID=U5DCJ6_AMBTC|nr:uncharacterized protein LOC18448664 [Amborella trichopoda]ERN20254.1 hypothetical protein AMTR_s00066p00160870 [Amborella trichopoda]|eukprot:XP_006858787.1 uncharacterized protein LOC18448664 [Amborella trichopoda]
MGETQSSRSVRIQQLFLLSSYVLLGAASSCIFLTLSLRLFPSLPGFLLILLHAATAGAAVTGCAAAATSKWHTFHMVATVMTAIFEGAVSVLIFTRSSEFLRGLKSYVREEDGVIILRMAGTLSILMFCMEWVVLGLGFVVRYYAVVGEERVRTGKVQEEPLNDWPWPFQV